MSIHFLLVPVADFPQSSIQHHQPHQDLMEMLEAQDLYEGASEHVKEEQIEAWRRDVSWVCSCVVLVLLGFLLRIQTWWFVRFWARIRSWWWFCMVFPPWKQRGSRFSNLWNLVQYGPIKSVWSWINKRPVPLLIGLCGCLLFVIVQLGCKRSKHIKYDEVFSIHTVPQATLSLGVLLQRLLKCKELLLQGGVLFHDAVRWYSLHFWGGVWT